MRAAFVFAFCHTLGNRRVSHHEMKFSEAVGSHAVVVLHWFCRNSSRMQHTLPIYERNAVMQILTRTFDLITLWGASKLLHSRILKYWQGVTPTPSREIQMGCSLRRGECER